MYTKLAYGLTLSVVVIAIALLPHSLSIQEDAPVPKWKVEEYLLTPVRVHLFRDAAPSPIGVTLTKEDVTRILKKANGIWHFAGIHLYMESLVEEKAVLPDGVEVKGEVPTGALRSLRPKATMSGLMLHVYYVGAMPVNGICIASDALFVQQAAHLKEVPGGIDEPLPRVTSHEIGHALGLPHRQDRTNLMASGTTGTSFNDEEIHTVRRTADGLKWIVAPEQLLKRAEALAKAGKRDSGKPLYEAITALPGTSPIKTLAEKALTKQP